MPRYTSAVEVVRGMILSAAYSYAHFLTRMASSSSSLSTSSASSLSSFEEVATRIIAERRRKRRNGGQDAGTTTQQRRKGGGSRQGKRPNKQRNRQLYHELLMKDYFNDGCTYDAKDFRRRFRMQRSLLLRILQDVVQRDEYFVQKRDACGLLGLSPHQKLTCALRFLAYGTSADQLDEYVRMGETTVLETVKRFCRCVIELYSNTYLRAPGEDDIRDILWRYAEKGWPGCLGALDVMHWEWKNCPMAWSGQFSGKDKVPTIALEAVVDCRLWFWHAFFGVPGTNNDLNILKRSPLFHRLAIGDYPEVTFHVNGNEYKYGFYLADGIYPSWKAIIKAISQPDGTKQQYFTTKQESQRKDVERGFGVLQVSYTHHFKLIVVSVTV
jgi:hypothetical protein